MHNATQATTHPSLEAAGLKARVTACLAERGIDLAGGRVLLVTLPRVLGYLFNPVSFYFCYDPQGRPVASLAEVTNTFKEMKPFVLGPATRTDTRGRRDLLSAPAEAFLRVALHRYGRGL